jgi:hypothetical protein
MKPVHCGLITLSLLAGKAVLAPANGHDWYPNECCNTMDCAPVESIVRLVPAGGGAPQLIVTSKYGKAILPHDFPVLESKDSRMHVCMRRHDSGDMDVICLFVPPDV